MSKVFSAHAVSVDGYISGCDPSDDEGGFGRGLGDAPMLFDWYFEGETPSRVADGFRLSEPSVGIFDALAARVGAAVAGHVTYEHSSRFGGGSPHPTAPLVVLSHGPVAEISDEQTLVTTGIEDAVAAARELAAGKDVALMGGGVVTAGLDAGLLDEVVLHQVPILLGAGRPFFQALSKHVRLSLIEAVPAAGVTHLHYAVIR
jgi:dihydrofolate reductase